MIDEVTKILYIEYWAHAIKQNLDAGKERTENKEFRITKKLKDEREKVQPVYNSKGKIIEYDKYGRHLNVMG